MNRREPIIFQTLGLLIAACGCIAAWLALPQIFPTPIPPPTDPIDPSQPTCQRQEVTFSSPSGSLSWFNPPLFYGDTDFGGIGPRVNIKVTVKIENRKQVYVNVYMAAQEDAPDAPRGDSRAQGETGFYHLGDISLPDRWRITSQTNFYGEITYDDIDLDMDVFPGDNSSLVNPPGPNYGPVQKLEIIGDIMGDDIGTSPGVNTGVRVTLKPLPFEITEVEDCVSQ